jgi:hypothetical protein
MRVYVSAVTEIHSSEYGRGEMLPSQSRCAVALRSRRAGLIGSLEGKQQRDTYGAALSSVAMLKYEALKRVPRSGRVSVAGLTGEAVKERCSERDWAAVVAALF